MGLFGLFEKNAGGAVRKHIDRATSKRTQALDRWESIQFLLRQGTPEALDGLMQRFSFYVDPSITDQEEKDAVFEGVARLGREALPSIRASMTKSESLSWPLKLLDRVLSEAEVVGVLIELLEPMDVEYERDPQRKIQLLTALGERPDSRTSSLVSRFLGDANETVRFHCVATILAQIDCSAQRDALVACLCDEESVRIRGRILDGFVARSWDLAGAPQVRDRLVPGFTMSAKGILKRSA